MKAGAVLIGCLTYRSGLSFALLLLVLTTFLSAKLAAANRSPTDDRMIDLSHCDLEHSECSIQGTLSFYPEIFLSSNDLPFPHSKLPKAYQVEIGKSWTFYPELENVQYGTYHLKIRLPYQERYSLAFYEDLGINAAFEIEAVGSRTIFARSGQIASQKESELHWWLSKAFPIPEHHSQTIELLIRVSSFSYRYKGIVVPPKIGSWQILEKKAYRNLIPIVAAVAVLLSLFIYHLLLYLLKRDEHTSLVFALSCLAMSLRLISTDRIVEYFYPEGIRWYAEINYRVLYSSIILLANLMFIYLSSIIGNFFLQLKKLKAISYLFWGLSVIPFLTPDYPTLHRMVFIYEGYAILGVIMAAILLTIHSIKNPQYQFEARLNLGLFILFSFAVINDVGYAHYVWDTFNAVPYFLIILFMSESILITSKYKKSLVLKTKLKEAKAVQEAFLPASSAYNFLSTASYYQVAEEEAGGDLFDYKFDAATNSFYIFIGDVTGHGIASSLVTGAASGAINGTLLACQSNKLDLEATLTQLLLSLNKAVLSSGKNAQRMMTMAIIGFNVITGQGYYVNAGHNPIYLINKKHRSFLLKPSNPLGLFDDMSFKPVSFQLKAQDRIFLYTDGLIENCSAKGKTLKAKKLVQLLQQAPTIQIAKQRLLAYSHEIWGFHPPDDDVTFVIAEWTPEELSTSNALNSFLKESALPIPR